MQRGEVRRYVFPSPDKKRPVVGLTLDSAIEILRKVTVAPLTTTIRDIPSEVLLTEADGLPKVCAVNLDYVQTVSKRKIGTLITTLRHDTMTQVGRALRFALGL